MLSRIRPFSEKTRTERLREIWKKTATVRLAVWAVLLAGSAVAATSGAFAVAWGIAAVRAGVAGTGAFLATEGLLRSCGFEKSVLGISIGVGLAVAAVLAVPGAEAAEAFVGISGSGVNPSSFTIASSDMPCEPIAPDTVRSVFADIRADHPGQNCVTLEQSVRRIEGLSRGIPLSESFRLASAVPDAHSLTCDPSGKIACAMRSLGFLPNVPDSAVDTAARKLSESDIARILEEAYGAGGDGPSALEIPETPSSKRIPAVMEDAVQEKSATNASPAFGLDREKVPFFAGALAALAVPFAAAYSWKRKRARKRDLPTTISVPPVSQPSAVPPLAAFPQTASPSVPVALAAVPESPIRTYPALRVAAGEILSGEYAFRVYEPLSFGADAEVSHASERLEFLLPTPAGEIRAALIEAGERPAFRFVWMESGTERFSTVRELEASGDERELQSEVRRALEESYFEFAVFREKAKREELRDIHSFEITDRDFSAIYRQLEEPATVAGNRETGGFWFSSGYSAKGGVLPLKNLANPLPEEIDATSVEFAIRPEKWENYVGTNVSKAFRSEFEPGERKLFARALERVSANADDPNPFVHAVDFFNWHKHPGSPLWPSGADINHPESASGKFLDSPGLEIITFVIANRFDGRDGPPANSHVLRGASYGGKADYLLTFWKLLRISDEERARRESFVRETGKTEASRLGICDRSGRLLHLDREVRAHGEIFEADLRPVSVRLASV